MQPIWWCRHPHPHSHHKLVLRPILCRCTNYELRHGLPTAAGSQVLALQLPILCGLVFRGLLVYPTGGYTVATHAAHMQSTV